MPLDLIDLFAWLTMCVDYMAQVVFSTKMRSISTLSFFCINSSIMVVMVTSLLYLFIAFAIFVLLWSSYMKLKAISLLLNSFISWDRRRPFGSPLG